MCMYVYISYVYTHVTRCNTHHLWSVYIHISHCAMYTYTHHICISYVCIHIICVYTGDPLQHTPLVICIHTHITLCYVYMHTSSYIHIKCMCTYHMYTHRWPATTHTTWDLYTYTYGEALISDLLKIIGLFCRISSLL